MSVKAMLDEMWDRAFDKTYDAYIREDYDRWAKKEFLTEEGEYDAAEKALPSALTPEQMEKLQQMEHNYQMNREYASRYGFKAGLFSGFNQYFTGTCAAEEGFDVTLEKNLMEMPGMQRHFEPSIRRDEIHKIIEELDPILSDENKEHLVSIECAWDQRIHSAACHSFYCGYRACLEILDSVKSMESIHMLAGTLMLEHHLGYISSYEQVERKQERKSA